MRFVDRPRNVDGHPRGASWARMHGMCTPRRAHALRASWGWARTCMHTACVCGCALRIVRVHVMCVGTHYARPRVRKQQQPPTLKV